MEKIPKEILEHFKVKLTWKSVPYRNEKGEIEHRYFDPNQTCNFCENDSAIITYETCCTGCSKLKDCILNGDNKGQDYG